jgi:signal transduction histidine kinase
MSPLIRHGLINAAALTALLIGFFAWSDRSDLASMRARTALEEQARVDVALVALEAEVKNVAAMALTLAASSSVRDHVKGIGTESAAGDFFIQMRHHPRLLQLRVLDDLGNETLRVNQIDGKPVVAPSEQLQPKANQYYVQESRALAPAEVYLSRLDLNMERGVVEQPERLVWRAVTPVGDDGSSVVVNANGQMLLSLLRDVRLLNGDEAPAWAAGQGQVWAGGLRTWAELNLFGRRMVLLAEHPSPRRGALLSLAAPTWVIFMLFAGLMAWMQANRADNLARLQSMNALLMQSREEERREVARWLHDELGQRVTAIALHLSRGAAASDPSIRGDALSSARHAVDTVLGRLHLLANELRTPVLDDLGLQAALQELVQGVGVTIEADVRVDAHVLPRLAEQAYRIVEEAIRNAERHAECNKVTVKVVTTKASLVLDVADDGKGLSLHHADGLGLMGLRERVAAMGGTLALTSRLGAGTRIEVCLPLGPV